MSADRVLVILSETKNLFYATIILLKTYDYDKTQMLDSLGLLEGGNAEKAGLRRGDRIQTINGIKANDSNVTALYPLPNVLTLTVMRENGCVEIVVGKEQ